MEEEVLDLEEGFTGLAAGGGDDEDESAGLGEESVGDEDGGESGFSPLAVAVEGDAFFEVGVAEDVGLGGFGVEVEEFSAK